MEQNQLGENLARYRKEKGLSQEKVAEYLSVSRQAVTKWEKNLSRPSSDHLIHLAELFDVSVDVLLKNQEHEWTTKKTNTISTQSIISSNTPVTTESTTNTGNITNITNTESATNLIHNTSFNTPDKVPIQKTPLIFIFFSILCTLAYTILSTTLDKFSFGTLICMFIIAFPIQLFIHLYFTNAIQHDSFTGIAGFDDKLEYNYVEVKKMLVRMDLHIGMLSSTFIFLFCILNCADLNISWINGLLIMVYTLNFILTILLNNYHSINKIYCNEMDKKKGAKSILIAIIYISCLFLGIGLMIFLFTTRKIENNTAPAMKLCCFLLLGVINTTIGFFIENNNIKKWIPDQRNYQISKSSIGCMFLGLLSYLLMCIL